MNEEKKAVSAGAIIAAIAGLLAIVVLVIFFAVRSDPASRAPNPPPRVDPAQKAAESAGQGPMERGPQSQSNGSQRPAPTVP